MIEHHSLPDAARKVRAAEPRKTPLWVNALFQRGRETWFAKARELTDEDVWLFEQDEQRTGQLLNRLLMYAPVSDIPGWSEERRRAAIEFWQSWQNTATGRFYDPRHTDPQAPADPKAFCNEKYVVNILRFLDAEPLVPHSTMTGEGQTAGEIDTRYFLDLCRNGGPERPWHTGGWGVGSWTGFMTLELVRLIEESREDLIPVLEEGLTLMLSHQNPRTGLWGDDKASLLHALGGALKVLGRLHFGLGVEDLPHMDRLADTLIAHRDEWMGLGNTHPCAGRNAVELICVCLETSDYRRDELFFTLDTLAQQYAEITAKDPVPFAAEYALSMASAYLHWQDTPYPGHGAADHPRGTQFTGRLRFDPQNRRVRFQQ